MTDHLIKRAILDFHASHAGVDEVWEPDHEYAENLSEAISAVLRKAARDSDLVEELVRTVGEADLISTPKRASHADLMKATEHLTAAARAEMNAHEHNRAMEINGLIIATFKAAIRVEDLEPVS